MGTGMSGGKDAEDLLVRLHALTRKADGDGGLVIQ
jgi:hypothetical protein